MTTLVKKDSVAQEKRRIWILITKKICNKNLTWMNEILYYSIYKRQWIFITLLIKQGIWKSIIIKNIYWWILSTYFYQWILITCKFKIITQLQQFVHKTRRLKVENLYLDVYKRLHKTLENDYSSTRIKSDQKNRS